MTTGVGPSDYVTLGDMLMERHVAGDMGVTHLRTIVIYHNYLMFAVGPILYSRHSSAVGCNDWRTHRIANVHAVVGPLGTGTTERRSHGPAGRPCGQARSVSCVDWIAIDIGV